MKKRLFSAIILASVILSSVYATSCSDNAKNTDEAGTSTVNATDTDNAGNDSDNALTTETVSEDYANSKATVFEVVDLIYKSYSDFPNIKKYSKPEADGSTEMKANEFSSFFGYALVFGEDGIAYPDVYNKLESYAIYTPTASLDVHEICVFKFKNSTPSFEISQLCEDRITKIKSNYASNENYDTDKSKKPIVESCTYKVFGSYAVLVCAANPSAALDAADNFIKSAK